MLILFGCTEKLRHVKTGDRSMNCITSNCNRQYVLRIFVYFNDILADALKKVHSPNHIGSGYGLSC